MTAQEIVACVARLREATRAVCIAIRTGWDGSLACRAAFHEAGKLLVLSEQRRSEELTRLSLRDAVEARDTWHQRAEQAEAALAAERAKRCGTCAEPDEVGYCAIVAMCPREEMCCPHWRQREGQ